MVKLHLFRDIVLVVIIFWKDFLGQLKASNSAELMSSGGICQSVSLSVNSAQTVTTKCPKL